MDEYVLSEARRNFKVYLTFRRPDDLPSFALETNSEVIAAKQNVIAVFEQWRTEANPAKRKLHWVAVESTLRQLQSTRQIEDAFSWTDSYDVVLALVGIVKDKCQAEGVETVVVSQTENTILNIHAFATEVFNGGFHQLFANSTGDHTQEIIAALKKIGAIKTVKLFEQALAIFPNRQVLNSQAERDSFLKRAKLDIFSHLDQAYFTQEENIYVLTAEYCRNHKSEFK